MGWYRKGQAAFRLLLGPYWPMALEGLDNLPASGGAILAGNHPTVLDGGMLGVYTPHRVKFLIDAKVLRLPLLGSFLGGLGSIPVERGSGSLRWAAAALERGEWIGIYPEAAPTGSLELGEFKRGVAVLAQQVPTVPVVPVAIVGTQPLCSHHHGYAQPGPIALRYGAPLYGSESDTIEEFLMRLRQALQVLQQAPLTHIHRWTPATLISACFLAPPSAALLALSRRRFTLD
ncbi:1-acyl-sn-glycerol-3-phosphate acyltransferase [bacterium]|nr:1-acyl-sn-glycerol-3-phosphate acyltransferase [bacterium]